MSIWKDPEISFVEFGKFVNNPDNKSLFSPIWDQATKDKLLLSDLASHELSSILVSFMKICIKSHNNNSLPLNDQLEDSSHLFSDWIYENKLSGIPLNDDDDYIKMKLIFIWNNNYIFKWISESTQPLITYIKSKTEHDPSLSQAEIMLNNKKMMKQHPSLAHLFQQKNNVNKIQNIFNQNPTQKQKQKQKQKHHINPHKIHQSKIDLYFNYSDVGYSVRRKCKLYSNKKLTKNPIIVQKNQLIGGKIVDKNTGIIQIIEPVKGFIHSQYVKSFDLNTQWKFWSQNASMGSIAGTQSLILQINDDDLLSPTQMDNSINTMDDDDDQKVDFNPYGSDTSDNADDNASDDQSKPVNDDNQQAISVNGDKNPQKKTKSVKFNPSAYNENEEEKQIEDNPTSFNDPNTSNYNKKILDKCRNKANKILKISQTQRKSKDVIDLWTAAFNLHDIGILKKCYSSQVTSQQFVNQELKTRDSVLQCFKQMFDASDDIGLEVSNCILKDGSVILEFRSWGTKKGSSTSSYNINVNDHQHLGSHPTKSGLPTKVINGIGVFHVHNGLITSQKLFFDQDMNWFTDMNVIRMPQTTGITNFLNKYKKNISPILNISAPDINNNNTENNSSRSPSSGGTGDDENDNILNGHSTADNNIIYEMQDEEFKELLALKGLNISDLTKYDDKQKLKQQNKQKAMAQAMFWLAVGAMFVFIVPKYLGKGKR